MAHTRRLHEGIDSRTELDNREICVASETQPTLDKLLYEEDQLFGANYNAYSTKWTGASQATPETGSAAADKAVRWAIASAEQSQVLTALTLPWEGPSGTAYAKWLAHPMVYEIKTIKESHIVLHYPMWETLACPKQAKTK